MRVAVQKIEHRCCDLSCSPFRIHFGWFSCLYFRLFSPCSQALIKTVDLEPLAAIVVTDGWGAKYIARKSRGKQFSIRKGKEEEEKKKRRTRRKSTWSCFLAAWSCIGCSILIDGFPSPGAFQGARLCPFSFVHVLSLFIYITFSLHFLPSIPLSQSFACFFCFSSFKLSHFHLFKFTSRRVRAARLLRRIECSSFHARMRTASKIADETGGKEVSKKQKSSWSMHSKYRADEP